MDEKSAPNCWHCGEVLEDLPPRLSFRQTCPSCDAFLHCCKGCRYYKVGLPNNCMAPGTDPIRDRDAANFCDEFAMRLREAADTGSIEEVSHRLFGESGPEEDRLDDLFK